MLSKKLNYFLKECFWAKLAFIISLSYCPQTKIKRQWLLNSYYMSDFVLGFTF